MKGYVTPLAYIGRRTSIESIHSYIQSLLFLLFIIILLLVAHGWRRFRIRRGRTRTFWRWAWTGRWRRAKLDRKVPSSSVSTLFVFASASRSVIRSKPFLTRGLDDQPETLNFFVIHLFNCAFSIIVVLKFLNIRGVTMKEYGPLYCIHTILPNYLNQLLRSSLVVFFPYPLTYISGLRTLVDMLKLL